jgi:hypothetical protein
MSMNLVLSHCRQAKAAERAASNIQRRAPGHALPIRQYLVGDSAGPFELADPLNRACASTSTIPGTQPSSNSPMLLPWLSDRTSVALPIMSVALY